MFSSDAKLGFFAQRDKYLTALDAGKVIAPAKDTAQMHQIVTNSTVDGVLAAFFALMVIVVLVNAAWVCVRAVRTGSTSASAEDPFVESHLVAPAGIFPTAAERRELATAGAGSVAGSGAGSGGGDSAARTGADGG